MSMLTRLALFLEIMVDEDMLPDTLIVGTAAQLAAVRLKRDMAAVKIPLLREAVHAVLILYHTVHANVDDARLYQQIAFMQVRAGALHVRAWR